MQCEICHAMLNSNRKLLSHITAEHSLSPSEYFQAHPGAQKFCSKCKRSLSSAQFFVDQSNTYGYRSQCISCMRPEAGKRECPVCGRTFTWSSVVNHMKEAHAISAAEAYKQHLQEKQCSKCKAIKPLQEFSKLEDENKVYFSWCRECNFQRAVERAKRDEEFTVAQLALVRLAFGDRCFVCGKTHDESVEETGEPLHIDHIVPHIDGGTLDIENALLLCRACNLSKGTRELTEYRRSILETDEEVTHTLVRLRDIHKWARTEERRLVTWQLNWGKAGSV